MLLSLVVVTLAVMAVLSSKDGDQRDDNELFAAYTEGDAAAFSVLFARYEGRITNFIYRFVGDRERAYELAQDTFMRVIRNAGSWEPQARFSTWIFTIARNLCRDEARRARHRQSESLDKARFRDDPQGEQAVNTVVDTRHRGASAEQLRDEFAARLQLLLTDLPPEQREVFLLRHQQGLRFHEIADVQEVTENTAKSRMRYALKALREGLADYEGFSFDADELGEIGDLDAPRHV